MITLVKTSDAAPLKHLRHLSARERILIAEIGGTARGIARAAMVRQWAREAQAQADVLEARAQMTAQSEGTGGHFIAEIRAQAEKCRRRAKALEAEALALMTTHPTPTLTSDQAWERNRILTPHRYKGV